jgi:hypothetical protein
MSTPPAGATVSEDGNYWWNADANQWETVGGGAAGSSRSSGTADPGTGAASTAASDDPLAGGGTATCDEGVINGACVAHELGADEIDQVLASAGVTLEA